jgi:hypothetical protein
LNKRFAVGRWYPINIVDDERGFLDLYILCLFSIGCIIIFSMMLATFAGAKKNATAAYSWFTEASDYTAHTAVMNGITTANDENSPYVRQYFDGAFTGITQTTANGNEYDPQTGSPFLEPVELTGFTPYQQGDILPNGNTAGVDGYWIAITVPVFVGTFPFAGQQSINVPMGYFAEL